MSPRGPRAACSRRPSSPPPTTELSQWICEWRRSCTAIDRSAKHDIESGARCLGGVVEDDTERIAMPCMDPAHAVAQRDPIGTALALGGPLAHGEDHGIALAQRHDLSFRLGSRPLLHE